MSIHFNKLACGPRALLILAARAGKPIDPDELWKKFCNPNEGIVGEQGAVHISNLLDMARAFGVARHMSITHDIDHAADGSAASEPGATGPTNVVGVLMTTELVRNIAGGGYSRQPHLWVVRQILVDSRTQQKCIEVESANAGQTARVDTLLDLELQRMQRAFLMFLK